MRNSQEIRMNLLLKSNNRIKYILMRLLNALSICMFVHDDSYKKPTSNNRCDMKNALACNKQLTANN